MTNDETAVDRFDDESPQTTPSLEGWEASGDTADLGEPDAPEASEEPAEVEPVTGDPLSLAVLVEQAAANDELGPEADPLWLAERSKQTGTKLF